MMEWPTVLENDDGIRPAGEPNRCFYCEQKVGQPHGRDCVIITKVVKVRYTFEIEVEIPHFWDSQDFEFHRNESSWCANNALDEIQSYFEGDCACGDFSAKFISDVDTAPRQKFPQ